MDWARRGGRSTMPNGPREDRRHEDSSVEIAELLRLAAEAAHIGTWSFDPQTGRSHWSPEVRALNGASLDEPASAEAAFRSVHPEDRARV